MEFLCLHFCTSIDNGRSQFSVGASSGTPSIIFPIGSFKLKKTQKFDTDNRVLMHNKRLICVFQVCNESVNVGGALPMCALYSQTKINGGLIPPHP